MSSQQTKQNIANNVGKALVRKKSAFASKEIDMINNIDTYGTYKNRCFSEKIV